MKYMFLIYTEGHSTEADAAREEQSNEIAEHVAFAREAVAHGQYITCDALQVATMATTVRVRGGKAMVTDGPFVESKEVLGGYYVLDCRDLEEALGLAAKIPPAKHGAIEVRPILEIPGWDEAIGLGVPRATT